MKITNRESRYNWKLLAYQSTKRLIERADKYNLAYTPFGLIGNGVLDYALKHFLQETEDENFYTWKVGGDALWESFVNSNKRIISEQKPRSSSELISIVIGNRQVKKQRDWTEHIRLCSQVRFKKDEIEGIKRVMDLMDKYLFDSAKIFSVHEFTKKDKKVQVKK